MLFRDPERTLTAEEVAETVDTDRRGPQRSIRGGTSFLGFAVYARRMSLRR